MQREPGSPREPPRSRPAGPVASLVVALLAAAAGAAGGALAGYWLGLASAGRLDPHAGLGALLYAAVGVLIGASAGAGLGTWVSLRLLGDRLAGLTGAWVAALLPAGYAVGLRRAVFAYFDAPAVAWAIVGGLLVAAATLARGVAVLSGRLGPTGSTAATWAGVLLAALGWVFVARALLVP